MRHHFYKHRTKRDELRPWFSGKLNNCVKSCWEKQGNFNNLLEVFKLRNHLRQSELNKQDAVYQEKKETKFDERFQRSQHDYDVCISLHLLTFLLLEFSIRKVPANTSNHSIPSPGVHWDQIQKDSLRAAIIYFAHFLAEYFTNNHSGISSMKWKRLAGNISRCLDKF